MDRLCGPAILDYRALDSDFWIATMLLLFLAVYIEWLPEFRWFEPWEDPK